MSAVLFLSDARMVFAAPYTPEKVEYLFSLVIDRHELRSGSTIVTSNTDVQEWWQFFPSKAMGMAFSDRLLEGAQGLRYAGPSIRGEMPPRREPTPTPSPTASTQPKATGSTA